MLPTTRRQEDNSYRIWGGVVKEINEASFVMSTEIVAGNAGHWTQAVRSQIAVSTGTVADTFVFSWGLGTIVIAVIKRTVQHRGLSPSQRSSGGQVTLSQVTVCWSPTKVKRSGKPRGGIKGGEDKERWTTEASLRRFLKWKVILKSHETHGDSNKKWFFCFSFAVNELGLDESVMGDPRAAGPRLPY